MGFHGKQSLKTRKDLVLQVHEGFGGCRIKKKGDILHLGTLGGTLALFAALRQISGALKWSRHIYSPWEWGRKIQPGR